LSSTTGDETQGGATWSRIHRRDGKGSRRSTVAFRLKHEAALSSPAGDPDVRATAVEDLYRRFSAGADLRTMRVTYALGIVRTGAWDARGTTAHRRCARHASVNKDVAGSWLRTTRTAQAAPEAIMLGAAARKPNAREIRRLD
jgi:hypothetical protein